MGILPSAVIIKNYKLRRSYVIMAFFYHLQWMCYWSFSLDLFLANCSVRQPNLWNVSKRKLQKHLYHHGLSDRSLEHKKKSLQGLIQQAITVLWLQWLLAYCILCENSSVTMYRELFIWLSKDKAQNQFNTLGWWDWTISLCDHSGRLKKKYCCFFYNISAWFTTIFHCMKLCRNFCISLIFNKCIVSI